MKINPIFFAFLVLSCCAIYITDAFGSSKVTRCRQFPSKGSNDLRADILSKSRINNDYEDYTGPALGVEEQQLSSRRQALASLAKTSLGVATIAALGSSKPQAANALDRTFPDELTDLDPKMVEISKTSRLNSQQRGVVAQQEAQRRQTLQTYNLKDDGLPSVVWGGALWFLTGSRSNPLITPLGNVLYDAEKEEWLKDRNNGLFAPPPIELLALSGFIFVWLGVLTEFIVLQLTGGDVNISLQLAGVTILNGFFLEIGRIAAGDKQDTKEENDRALQLQEEFQEFADKRLQAGGNCHRNDVIKAFRRYFAKYRQKDSEEYPLTDLEIERLLKSWNKVENFGRAEMTSSGFYYGIQINSDADVFI